MNIRSLEARNEINVTPLIDVLLVLVVILILSAPMALHRVPMPLGSNADGTTPKVIGLSIDPAGELYLEGTAVNRAQLASALALAAGRADAPVLEIRPQATTRYELVADALALATRSGLAAIRVEGAPAE